MSIALTRELGAALVVAALVLLVLGWRLRGLWLAARLARHRRDGARGEARAHWLLERHGYAIVAAQEAAVGRLLVDGAEQEYALRADAIVEKDGQRLVAEVKTGAAAVVTTRATRRQLLEYAYTFRLDGVLLVDMAEERIVRVDFPGLTTASVRSTTEPAAPTNAARRPRA